MHKTQLAVSVGQAHSSNGACVGKARGGKVAALIAVISAGMVSVQANAAITVPTEMLDIFTDLAVAFGTLVAAGAVLFGVMRGGIALFKIAGRIFSAAGA